MNHEGKILHLCNQDLRLGQPRAQASEEQSFEAAHGLLFNGGQMNQHHDKLNVYEIDAVKDALRAAIEEEKMYLMEDIDYLTALLTDEADMRGSLIWVAKLAMLEQAEALVVIESPKPHGMYFLEAPSLGTACRHGIERYAATIC
eukprot:scaffold110851_cov18-Tisochrysis_lutea.AAC.1